MRTSRSRARAGALAALLATATIVAAAPARAGIVAYATRSSPTYQATPNNAVHSVPLTKAGATSLAFKATAAGQLFQVTFNAECKVFSSVEDQAWVGIVIRVNGQPLQPYEAGDPTNVTFCSSVWDNFAGQTTIHAGVYVSASRVAIFKAPSAGTFTLTIQAWSRTSTSTQTVYYQLDDIVVTVTN